MADPRQTWSDYHDRKKAERLSEADALWQAMRAAGVDEAVVLALDFVCFGPARPDADGLARQLSENYHVRVDAAKEPGYYTVTGTTRPHGITLDAQRLKDWVAFMADVARSHACVFSEWTLEAPALRKAFRSAEF